MYGRGKEASAAEQGDTLVVELHTWSDSDRLLRAPDHFENDTLLASKERVIEDPDGAFDYADLGGPLLSSFLFDRKPGISVIEEAKAIQEW